MQLEELVRRIRRGDKEAVKELVSAYGNSVYQRAYERTRDKELAREAARQTFGQFVAIVQQQPEDDGWSLWFGDLIERNIATYTQISTDMRTIESELDSEILSPVSAKSAPPAPGKPEFASKSAPDSDLDQPEPRPRGKGGAETNVREEIFDEPYQKKEKRRSGGHGFSVVLLILVSLILLWVVAGVAMTMRWIPAFDLGYSWFNLHVFKLF
jgi:hypothetical protein